MSTRIYYDGDCPFCTRYTTLVRLREAVGPVGLIDVRREPEALAELEREGFDLDKGMVFEHQGRRHGGAQAMTRIARLSSGENLFNRISATIFGVPMLAALLYPLLRAGRGLSLFALGRQRIRGCDAPNRSLFALFAHAWGVFSVLHLLYYIFYDRSTQVFPSTWAIGIFGAMLALRPRSARVFVALTIAMLIDSWLQMPVYSNHTVVRNFVLMALAAAAAYAWLRGRSWTDFMASFAPVGRSILLIMYVFGVFHKLNTDFLDPAVSCAVALWDTMPEPLRQLDAMWFRWLAIYGTLILEVVIIVGLLTRRMRHWSIVAGIGFHSMLALSGFGFYPSFSALTIALHLLYLSPEGAARIVASPLWRRLQEEVHTLRGILLVGGWMLGLWALTHLGNTSSVGLAWLPWSVWLALLVSRYGRVREDEHLVGPAIHSRTWAINVFSVLFFLNCYAPYLGAKNAQSINMFANLVYEGGQSNHLIMRGAPGPLPYLNDVVRPFDAKGNDYLDYVEANELHVTYYDLLNQLERNPLATVSYERNGRVFRSQNAGTLQTEIERVLHPRWVRNWFLFRPVDLNRPKGCSISQ